MTTPPQRPLAMIAFELSTTSAMADARPLRADNLDPLTVSMIASNLADMARLARELADTAEHAIAAHPTAHTLLFGGDEPTDSAGS